MEFRDLNAQYASLKDEVDAAIQNVLDSGRFIGGAEVTALEEELASYVGAKHCITCGNGTDALQLALMGWGIGPGDAVFVPDFTFFSSGEVVSAVGATPVFVDVDERTFNLNPEELSQAVKHIETSSDLIPRAVVAVDLFGLPADYPAIEKICEAHDLLLLEDGAQGFGGSINGKMACSFGDISTTSFFPAKPLGCYGDGGAIFTDDDEWAALIRSLAVHGKGSMKYDNVRTGMNSRLDAIQAAILRVKLQAFEDHELSSVQDAASRYQEILKPIAEWEGITLPIAPSDSTSSWAQYTIQLPARIDRDTLQQELRAQGVPTMVYYPKPMHEQRAFKGACLHPGSCTTTERLCACVLSLPIGPYMSSADQQEVANRLRAYLGREAAGA